MKVILYRILGNDIPNRHAPGQTLDNLRFLLEHEPSHSHLEKRWLLNRIVDSSYLDEIHQLIKSYNQKIDVLPFEESRYLQCWCDAGNMPSDNFPGTRHFGNLAEPTQSRLIEYLRRSKSLYLVNNNGARNHAITLGFNDNADWVLPWDGGCFLTTSGWQAIYAAMAAGAGLSYISVPMARTDNNQVLLDASYSVEADIEPQICFSRTARLYFDPSLRYGSMPKSRLLQRLGVPGKWQTGIGHFPWEQVDTSPPADSGNFVQAGWVARLSGNQESQRLPEEAYRWVSRFKGTIEWTQAVDRESIRKRLAQQPFFCWTSFNDSSPPVVASPLDAQLADLSGRTLSLGSAQLRNSLLAGNRQDSKANSNAAFDLAKGALINSVSVTPAQAGVQNSQAIIDSRLRGNDISQNFPNFTQVISVLALDFKINQHSVAGISALRLINTAIATDNTGCHPDHNFIEFLSPVTINSDIDTALALNSLFSLCDAVALIFRSELADTASTNTVYVWFGRFLTWLINSSQGIGFSNRTDHVGTAYHLALLSLACFLAKYGIIDNVINGIPRLMARQFTSDGHQRLGTIGQDSNAPLINIEIWANIAKLCAVLGRDLWSFEDSAGRGLAVVYNYYAESVFTNISPNEFERQRIDIIAAMASKELMSAKNIPNPAAMKNSAIPPFWQFCRSLR